MLLLSKKIIVIKSSEKKEYKLGLSSAQANDVCNDNNNKHSNKALKVIVMALIDSHTAKQQHPDNKSSNWNFSLYYFLSIL